MRYPPVTRGHPPWKDYPPERMLSLAQRTDREPIHFAVHRKAIADALTIAANKIADYRAILTDPFPDRDGAMLRAMAGRYQEAADYAMALQAALDSAEVGTGHAEKVNP